MSLKVESHTHTENVTGQFQIDYAQIHKKCDTAKGIANQRAKTLGKNLSKRKPGILRVICSVLKISCRDMADRTLT